MENNVWELLDVNPEIQKEPQGGNDIKGNTNCEKALKIIANIILICGIIATVVMQFTTVFPEPNYGEREFSLSGFIYTVVVLLSSIITWGVLTILSNISINLFKIKDILSTNKKSQQ